MSVRLYYENTSYRKHRAKTKETDDTTGSLIRHLHPLYPIAYLSLTYTATVATECRSALWRDVKVNDKSKYLFP